MTELQQSRADYIEALERINKLEKENFDLLQRNFELQMKANMAECRASISEAMGSGLLRSMFTL